MSDKTSVTLAQSQLYLFKCFDSIQTHNCFAYRFVFGVKSLTWFQPEYSYRSSESGMYPKICLFDQQYMK